jgi:cysteine-rich repeat protein
MNLRRRLNQTRSLRVAVLAVAMCLAAAAPGCGSNDNAPPDTGSAGSSGSGAGGVPGEAGAAGSNEAGAFGEEVQPPPSTCGNKMIEGIEQCDDGNLVNGDGCSATCSREACDDCRYGSCFGDESTSGCSHLLGAERNDCLRVYYCILASHCAKGSKTHGSECYCGAADCLGDAGTTAATGVCADVIQAAAGGAGVSKSQIAAQLGDSTTALGSAFMLIGCELDFCAFQCLLK